MDVRDNHTTFEPETQRWRPGMGVASGGPQFQKLQFRAKNGHFWTKRAQNAIPRAPNPPATLHILWFPPLRIAEMDAWTPVPRPGRLRQAASNNRNRWVPKWVNRVQ